MTDTLALEPTEAEPSFITPTTDETFQADVLTVKEAVIVIFTADWCGPCKLLTPILEKLAQEKAGKLKVVSVNTEESATLPSRFGVKGLPTMHLFKLGQLLGMKTGAVSETFLREWLAGAVKV